MVRQRALNAKSSNVSGFNLGNEKLTFLPLQSTAPNLHPHPFQIHPLFRSSLE